MIETTKGPWHRDEQNTVRDSADRLICDPTLCSRELSTKEVVANARLIAAAPDLANALLFLIKNPTKDNMARGRKVLDRIEADE